MRNYGAAIPVYRSRLPRTIRLVPNLLRIERSQVYSNHGPLVRKLELEISEKIGVQPDSVAVVSNATVALEGAIETADTPFSTWISPSWTFAATAHALSRAKVDLIFGDVDDRWRLDLESLEFLVAKTSILDVVPFGDQIDPNRYLGLKSPTIVDAAVSLGQVIEKRIKYEDNLGIVFSLHATKPISSGEGGVFVSENSEWMSRFRSWSAFGFKNERSAEMIGTNAKMSEYSAAVGLASLRAWDKTRARLVEISEWAKDISKSLNLEVQPSLTNNSFAPYWVLKLNSEAEIDSFVSYFSLNNIQTRRWWSHGCHRMRAFENVKKASSLKKTESLAALTIGLPFYIDLRNREMKKIEKTLEEWIVKNNGTKNII